MARPLVVYFTNVHYFSHPRRVYIAARSRTRAWQISGVSQETLKTGESTEAGTAWAPPFIQTEGVWLEIRDHNEEGWIRPDRNMDDTCTMYKARVPANEKAFIRCTTLTACKEAFTLLLDRALEAAGHPREELQ